MTTLDALGVGVLLSWSLLPLLVLFASRPGTAAGSRRRAMTAALVCSAVTLAVPAVTRWLAALSVVHELGEKAPVAARSTVTMAGEWIAGNATTGMPLLRFVAGAWLVLVTLGALRLVRARWRLGRWVVRGGSLSSLRPEATALCTQAGIEPARVCCEPTVPMPMAWGWRRPQILLPERLARELPLVALGLVLQHEAEHVRRGHVRSAWVTGMLSALFFGHPALGSLVHRLGMAREEEVDRVLADVDLAAYTDALLRVAEAQLVDDASPLLVAGAGGSLHARIAALTSDARPTRRVSLAPTVAALVVVVATSLAWSACASSAAGSTPAAPDGSAAENDAAGPKMGALPKEVIQSVISEHKSEVRHCHEKALVERNSDLGGNLAVRWVIAADGSVASAKKLDNSTIDDETMVSCVLDAIRTWRFPEPAGGGIVEVNYPFTFAATAEPPSPSAP